MLTMPSVMRKFQELVHDSEEESLYISTLFGQYNRDINFGNDQHYVKRETLVRDILPRQHLIEMPLI